ncbi:hypothetical protein BD289DRAFT_22779 [Coniella lustricola]|uniref:Uncharacterized protein n=1 Tax=Coniella lustricola TaxID=2025994 RepID=A0A2T3A3G7_9PEZI|nr:hypothetical protein BD289DRAFT_22779 [Coniella lustricola]
MTRREAIYADCDPSGTGSRSFCSKAVEIWLRCASRTREVLSVRYDGSVGIHPLFSSLVLVLLYSPCLFVCSRVTLAKAWEESLSLRVLSHPAEWLLRAGAVMGRGPFALAPRAMRSSGPLRYHNQALVGCRLSDWSRDNPVVAPSAGISRARQGLAQRLLCEAKQHVG